MSELVGCYKFWFYNIRARTNYIIYARLHEPVHKPTTRRIDLHHYTNKNQGRRKETFSFLTLTNANNERKQRPPLGSCGTGTPCQGAATFSGEAAKLSYRPLPAGQGAYCHCEQRHGARSIGFPLHPPRHSDFNIGCAEWHGRPP